MTHIEHTMTHIVNTSDFLSLNLLVTHLTTLNSVRVLVCMRITLGGGRTGQGRKGEERVEEGGLTNCLGSVDDKVAK